MFELVRANQLRKVSARLTDGQLRQAVEIIRARSRVILPERDLHAAADFAKALRETIEQTRFVFEDHHIPLTISVGVAELEPHITTADALIQSSDARLRRAKSLGRNRVVSSDDEGEDIDPSESNRQA